MNVLQYWLLQGRRTSFRMLLFALVLAVASVSSVGIFSARIDAALQRDATQMLGGDLVVASNNNPTQTPWYALFSQSQYMGLDKASSVQFPSVLSSEMNDVFVSLKAVDGAYPLMGALRVADQQSTSADVKHGPSRGEVWVDQQVLDTLGLQLGQTIQIGQLPSTISKVILLEPERNGGFINFAPRAMIHLDDVPATGLLGTGSRAKWRLYLNGPSNVLNALAQQIQPQLSQSEEILTLEKGRPEIHKTLEIASSFLSMAALIASLIACVGIALSSHHFAKEQAKDLSILKSLGFTPKQLLRTNLWGFLIVTIAVGGLGAAMGWLAHWILLLFLSDILRVELPMAGLYHLPLGILLSAVLISGFAIFPLMNALKIPTLVVLRQQHTQLKSTRFQRALSISIGALGAWGMCALVMSNITLACLLFFGFVGVFLVFSALLLGLLKIFSWSAKPWVQRLGINVIQNMSKQALSLVLQGGGLSIGLAALFTLALVQGDLIEHWQAVIPKNAPNRFVFNIQADQKDAVYSMLQQHSSSDIRLYPMVRGRLIAINGKTVSENTYSDQRAKNLIQREFNLSYASQVPLHNRIIQGQWLDPQFKTPQLSLEKSMAERLKLTVGDTLGFDIAGTTVSATISSIRQLRWDSMEVNFLAMFAQDRLQNLPETWITSVYLPPNQAHAVSKELLKSHPNLTVLNTEQLLTQVRNILAQVAKAAQFVFLFTLLAGGVVMLTSVSLGAPEKARQAAIYRALGASSHQLQKAAWVELGILGSLSGFSAALMSQCIAFGIAHYVFEFEYIPSWLQLLVGTGIGLSVSLIFGSRFIHRVCHSPVMQNLRSS